jgi:SOS response associated peptidase (SRAP)
VKLHFAFAFLGGTAIPGHGLSVALVHSVAILMNTSEVNLRLNVAVLSRVLTPARRPWEDDWNPRYNIAPAQPVPVIRQDAKEPARQLSLVRWGLIPSWAKDASGAAKMINARSETAATKPAFRDALKFRRCLIPADGFYEWQRTGNTKQPFCFEVNDGGLFAFASLWERWKDASGNAVETCSILTNDPERCDGRRPLSHAGDSRSRLLRPLARSGNERRACSIRDVETLRCRPDALLPGEHPDQSCGQRRRRMLCARATHPGSESPLPIERSYDGWGHENPDLGIWG